MRFYIVLIYTLFLVACVSESVPSDGTRSPSSSRASEDDNCSTGKMVNEKEDPSVHFSVCHFSGDDDKKHEVKVIELKEINSLLMPDLRQDPKLTPKESRTVPGTGSGFFSPKEYNQKGLGPVHALNINGGNGEFHLVLVSGKHKYFMIVDGNGVAVAGANDLGVSISLHLVPVHDNTSLRTISSAPRPELPQQTEILSELLSQGDAAPVIEQKLQAQKVSGHFSAFIADANTGEAKTLEIGKDKTRLWEDPIRKRKPIGQSNHFLHAQMQDQYEFESFGSSLDSHARYLRLFDLVAHIKEGELSLAQSLDILGDHYDSDVPPEPPFGNERSFGSTVVRSDSRAMALIMPDSARPKVWLSIGDHPNGPLNHLVGFEVDFNSMTWKTIGMLQTEKWNENSGWLNSFDDFTSAVLNAENQKWEEAISDIDNAVKNSETDRNRFDPFYHFAKARLILQMAVKEEDLGVKKDELIIALDEFDHILAKRHMLGSMKSTVFFSLVTGASLVESYIEALTKLYSVAAAVGLEDVKAAIKSDEQQALIERHQMDGDQKSKRLLAAEDSLQFVLKQTQNPEIRAKLQFLEDLKAKKKFDDLPWQPVDLVSIVN